MIQKTIIEAVTKQIQHEQNNAHTYEAVALYFEHRSLHGLAGWMKQQAADERTHAQKFIDHLADRGQAVPLGALSAPPTTFDSPLAAARSIMELEQHTTALIHKLYELARQEKDYALEVLLHWYITEQVEEEKSAMELTALMEQFHKNPGQLFMLDHRWPKIAKGE